MAVRADTPDCECGRLEDPAVVGMGHHEGVFRTLDEVRHRGSPWWWVLSFRCRACGQDWLVASEERQNDVYILRRLDEATAARIAAENVWPPDFDRYETLLEIGRAAGRWARFPDVAESPVNSPAKSSRQPRSRSRSTLRDTPSGLQMRWTGGNVAWT